MHQILVYITAPDMDCARKIGRTLVEHRLAACVNILPHMESIYWWDNAVQNEAEVVLLAKSTQDLFKALEAQVVAVHPYTTPCIVAVRLEHGHQPFLQWIQTQVSSAGN